MITGVGGGWRRVFLDNSKETNFVAVFLSEAYHLAQARSDIGLHIDHTSRKSWANAARSILTRAWSNWNNPGSLQLIERLISNGVPLQAKSTGKNTKGLPSHPSLSARLPNKKEALKSLMKRARIRLWTAERIEGDTEVITISKPAEEEAPLTFPGGSNKSGRLVPPRQAALGERFNSAFTSKRCGCGKWVCILTAVTENCLSGKIQLRGGVPTIIAEIALPLFDASNAQEAEAIASWVAIGSMEWALHRARSLGFNPMPPDLSLGDSSNMASAARGEAQIKAKRAKRGTRLR
eukprot:16440607-Heterocapsa_arctica.AAC.1